MDVRWVLAIHFSFRIVLSVCSPRHPLIEKSVKQQIFIEVLLSARCWRRGDWDQPLIWRVHSPSPCWFIELIKVLYSCLILIVLKKKNITYFKNWLFHQRYSCTSFRKLNDIKTLITKRSGSSHHPSRSSSASSQRQPLPILLAISSGVQ